MGGEQEMMTLKQQLSSSGQCRSSNNHPSDRMRLWAFGPGNCNFFQCKLFTPEQRSNQPLVLHAQETRREREWTTKEHTTEQSTPKPTQHFEFLEFFLYVPTNLLSPSSDSSDGRAWDCRSCGRVFESRSEELLFFVKQSFVLLCHFFRISTCLLPQQKSTV